MSNQTTTGDPVINALVRKIPPANAPWAVDDQIMWLRMMAMAFESAYGGKCSTGIVFHIPPKTIDKLPDISPMIDKVAHA